jgi:hypothetical protein
MSPAPSPAECGVEQQNSGFQKYQSFWMFTKYNPQQGTSAVNHPAQMVRREQFGAGGILVGGDWNHGIL